ncbi:MAG: O-antigen ligase family protein [Bacteroidota bacterium]
MISELQEKNLNTRGKKLFFLITGLFLTASIIAVTKDQIYFLLLPFVIYIVMLAIFRMEMMALFCAFITPLSINLNKTSLGIGISLPADPLMFGLFILFWFKILIDGGLNNKILKHPVTILILLHLGWMLVTTLTSSMFMVSLKSTLARMCYVTVSYFMLLYIFQNYYNIKRFLWMYLSTLLAVIAYTLFNHYLWGWTEAGAHISMVPFYNDHTAYAAAIAFFIPVTISFISDKHDSIYKRGFSALVLLFISIAIILSYTRASWVGLLAAFVCWLGYVVRIKTALVYGMAAAVILLFILFRSQLFMHLEKNDKTSSTDIQQHVESIGNVSNDASNIERLNRWSSAIRMFADKPIFGFGPGTFMFQYAPYQKYSERSIISTNFGTVGGSHSEYLGPLAEEGMFGSLLKILIITATIITASRIYKREQKGSVRSLTKALLLGLITYYVHGVLNFFLDTDKLSVLFWGFTAAIVAIDLFHSSKKTEMESVILQ